MDKPTLNWEDYNYIATAMSPLNFEEIEDNALLSDKEILEFNKQIEIILQARKAIRPLVLKAQGRFNPDGLRLPAHSKP